MPIAPNVAILHPNGAISHLPSAPANQSSGLTPISLTDGSGTTSLPLFATPAVRHAMLQKITIMTPEEFRRLGYQIVDRIADYRATVAARPVMARTAPGEIKAALPADPPQSPEPFDAILADLDRIVMPGLSHWQHPSFFGYFPSNAELSSVLGDYLSTGLGALGLSWQSCPERPRTPR